jgi:hypothetical protein
MIDILLGISAPLKVLIVFVLVVATLKFRVPLGLGMLCGGIAVGLWFRMSPLATIRSIALSFVDETTVTLMLIIALILLLSQSMAETGQLSRIVSSFRRRFSHYKLSLAVFPALIGLLPMPGGAYFSAPMVDTVALKELSPERKTVINYWFRHVWEYAWPLFPGVLLGSALLGLSLGRFIVHLVPLTFVAIGLGYLFLLTRIGRAELQPGNETEGGASFLYEILPIIIIIAVSVFVEASVSIAKKLSPSMQIIPERTGLTLALAVGVFWVWERNRMTTAQILGIIRKKTMWILILTILGVMAFRGVLTDSGAVNQIAESLAGGAMPMIAISMLIPFLVGMVTGVTVAYVGTTFPILTPLIAAQGLSSRMPSFAVLAYCSGYMGTMLSPTHLCLILTKEYFKAGWSGIYRLLIGPSILTLAAALGLYFLYMRM